MKSSTNWITIPEETFHTPASLPDRQAGNTERKTEAQKPQREPVKHKLFWGVGFAVVMIASFAMLAPQQFGSIIQGNLFDAPGVETPNLAQSVSPLGILPTRVTPTASDEAPFLEPANQTVVQPESAPVSVQVTPVVDANQRLIQELQKQVADLKNQQQTVVSATADKSVPFTLPPIPGLPAIPAFPFPIDLRGAAPEAASATATLGQTAVDASGYRLNSHRAPVTPQMVLQQNLAGGYRATNPSVAAPVSPQAAYRANLSGVQGTPDTGPREVMTVALIMTFLIVIGWKGYKLSRS